MGHRIISVLRLIRISNLFIIAATQYAMRYLLMEPLLPSDSFELQFGGFQFFLLVLATVLIAAAGYIINDYFDTQADLINRPGNVVVGIQVSRRVAMASHAALNILGIGLGIYLSLKAGVPALSLLFFIASGMLWFYSTNYKRQFLVGNLSVAFLTGMVPLMAVLFEIPLLNREYGEIMIRNQVNFNYIFAWVGGFSFFAFLTTLIREIIKDAEDFEGDMAYGMRTVPIVLGTLWTKISLVVLLAFNLFMLGYLLVKYILFSVEPADYISLAYFLVMLVIPLLLLAVQVVRVKDRRGWKRASIMIKWIMLSGILYSAIVFYLVKFKY